jgi:NAD(P)-dependent dehydrogenase (short-subunit alcohol dehydrogenase family)
MNLTGKACLITGGSGGIGSATAIALARRGADVAITSLPTDTELIESVKTTVENAGSRCIAFTGNIGDPEEASRCVEGTAAAFGRLDVLIHCAGGPVPGGLMEVSPEAWHRMVVENDFITGEVVAIDGGMTMRIV